MVSRLTACSLISCMQTMLHLFLVCITSQQRQDRCKRQREQYALQTTFCHRESHANLTPELKRAKVYHQKERCKLQPNTLHPYSIAMENPFYSSSDESVRSDIQCYKRVRCYHVTNQKMVA
jgi:hypothetical protein